MSKIEASGDVPPSRSGHACCAFGKNMFLFGGIDFENEAVYNDLYVLNTGNEMIVEPTTFNDF